MIAASSMDSFHPRPPPLPDEHEYNRLARLVQSYAGIRLPPDKRREMGQKLARHWQRGEGSLLTRIARSPELLQEVVEDLTVGESYFYRNRPHIEALRSRVIPDLMRDAKHRRQLSFWSAACATGEEPYSLAMLLDQHFEATNRWSVSIRGSDLNRDYLAQAKRARYSDWSLRGLEPSLVQRYFQPIDGDEYQLLPTLHKRVTLAEHNLIDDRDPPGKPAAGFDLILCRNVLIYFDRQVSNHVLSLLIAALRPGGYLFVGHVDSYAALGALDAVYECGTFYYRKPVHPKPTHARISQIIPGLPVETSSPADTAQGATTAPRIQATPTVTPATETSDVTGEDPVELSLSQARKSADRSEQSKALAELRDLVDGAGKLDHRAHFLRALVADQAGFRAEASQSLRQALFLRRDFVVAHYFLGVMAERNRDWSTAQRSFRNVASLLAPQPADQLLEETAGMTAGRLQTIVRQRLDTLRAKTETR